MEVVFLKRTTLLRPEDTCASWRSMQLTDPPTLSGFAYLFMNSGDSPCRLPCKGVTVEAMDNNQGLTLGDLIVAANRDASGNHYTVIRREERLIYIQDTTLTDVLTKVKESTRKPIKLEPLHTEINLKYMVLPSDEEWASMKKHARTPKCDTKRRLDVG